MGKVDKFMILWEDIRENITPIRMFAFLTIIVAIVDNISSVLQHATSGGITTYTNTPFEWILRGFFFFCGIFGIIGNGKTKRIRATIVSLPYIYLMAFYFVVFTQFNNEVLLTLALMMGIPGLWILLFGDKYE